MAKRSNKRKRMKALNLPEGLNLYLEEKHLAAAGNQEARLSVEAFDKMMDHFDYPAEKREQMGNVIMRFAMMLSIQPEGKQFSVDPDDAAMNRIVDVYEHYNRLLGAALDGN